MKTIFLEEDKKNGLCTLFMNGHSQCYLYKVRDITKTNQTAKKGTYIYKNIFKPYQAIELEADTLNEAKSQALGLVIKTYREELQIREKSFKSCKEILNSLEEFFKTGIDNS